MAAGCAEPRAVSVRAERVAAPDAAAHGELCADLGARRICWQGNTPELVLRTLPGGAAPPDGYRCGGMGTSRVCEPRTRNAGRFECGRQRCLQARPRYPDDGEWECVELSGIGFCHSRGAMAGVAAGPPDLGWVCGARRGGAEGERICLDLDPDWPTADGAWRCRYEPQTGGAARSCVATRELLAGAACSGAARCPAGTRCELGACLPTRPVPACWLDADCAAPERCVVGTCAKEGG